MKISKSTGSAAGALALAIAIALAGCVTTDTSPIVPIDISALEGQWEGKSKRWGETNKLKIYKDDDGRAIAYYSWGGWCRSTRNYMLKNPKITPTTVEFGLGRAAVVYKLEGDVLKCTFDSPGTHWDHSHELRRK